MWRAFTYSLLVMIIAITWISTCEAKKNRFYTLCYIRKSDGTNVTESYRSLNACREQEIYLEMVEKNSIIKSRCK